MRRCVRVLVSALAFAGALAADAHAHAADAHAAAKGVSASEIKLGNTMPYSGPASAYSTIGRVVGGQRWLGGARPGAANMLHWTDADWQRQRETIAQNISATDAHQGAK